jgi:hypothetical protein
MILNTILQLGILSLFFLNEHKKKELWVLSFYLAYSVLSTIFLNLFIFSISGKEYLSYRIFTLVEGLCFMSIFWLIVQNAFAKKALVLLAFLFIGVSLYDYSQSKAESFDSVPTVLECLILIAFSIFYFFEQMRDTSSLFIYNTPNFWLVVGVMIFFSGSFFVFIYAQSNAHLPGFNSTFKLIMGISSLIQNILFLIAFIIAKNESKTIKSSVVARTTLTTKP